MNKNIKLNCPMCNVEFVTSHRKRIWCNKECGDKFRLVKENIETNNRLQKRMNNNSYRYDFDSNKFYITFFL